MELAELKATVGQVREQYAFSQRWACCLVRLAVATYRYRSSRSDEPLRTKLVELVRDDLLPAFRTSLSMISDEGSICYKLVALILHLAPPATEDYYELHSFFSFKS